MAYLKSDISGQVLYYYELPTLVISSVMGVPIRVMLSTDDKGVILDEIYRPDLNGEILLEIKDIVSNELHVEIPSSDSDTLSTSIFKVFHFDIADGEVSGSFTVNGFSKEASDRISDVDIIRVPKNYRLPLSLHNFYERHGIVFQTSEGKLIDYEALETNASGVGVTSRLIHLDTIPDLQECKSFSVKLQCGDKMVSAPVFEVCNGAFEQYLFANRYGGFDNIAMDGVFEFLPDMSFESGTFNGYNEQTLSEAEYIYSQNSGYQSRKVIELLSELLCSSQIYHLDRNGEFRRIIIIDTDLTSSSKDHLHYGSFRFKYAESTRPLSLKGKSSSDYSLGHGKSSSSQMHKLTSSPMTVNHNKGDYPSVTVIDENNQVVSVSVEYLDPNNILLTWNGDLSGYVYIR